MSFDLWISKDGHDIFALVINFSKVNWQPKQITFNFFEPTNTSRQTLAKNLTNFLEEENYYSC
jgi:hypothetical protein